MIRRDPGERVRLVFTILAVAALVAAFTQVTLGGVVRVTGSGLGCPDWPLCHGQVVPPFELATIIEYSHRLAASVLGVLMVGVAIVAWVYYRRSPWILASSTVGLGMVVLAAVLGGVTVLTELEWWVRLIHLGTAEIVVAATVFVLVALLWAERRRPVGLIDTPETDRFNLLVLVTVVGVFVLILSGSYMVGYGAGSSCGTWPLCRGSLVPDGTPYAVHMGHRFLAALVGLLIAATAVSAWSRRSSRPELGWTGVALALLFTGQVVAGAATVWAGFSTEMRAIHLSLGTLAWVGLMFLAAFVYSPQRFALGRLQPSLGRVTELESAVP